MKQRLSKNETPTSPINMFFKMLTLCGRKISCNKEPSNYIKKNFPMFYMRVMHTPH
jgi:hypothetical protein